MQSDLAQPEKVRELLLEGTVQAGSTHVPEVFIHKTLAECLEALRSLSLLKGSKDQNPITRICLDNINPACSLSDVTGQDVIAAIGSERGWTDRERKLLESKGFVRCGMGERIMRTETAATVAGSIILSELEII